MKYARLTKLLACAGVICLSFCAFGQSQHTAPEKPIETTVCQVVAHCKKFDGKRVQFHASVSSDWFEYSVLVDPQCKQGVVPRISDEADKRPDVNAFNHAMDKGKAGTTDLHISAIFSGTFICRPTSPSPKEHRVIEIDQVDALEVTRAKSAER